MFAADAAGLVGIAVAVEHKLHQRRDSGVGVGFYAIGHVEGEVGGLERLGNLGRITVDQELNSMVSCRCSSGKIGRISSWMPNDIAPMGLLT